MLECERNINAGGVVWFVHRYESDWETKAVEAVLSLLTLG